MKKKLGFVVVLVILAGVLGLSVVTAMGAKTIITPQPTANGVSVTLEHCETDGWTAFVVLRLDLPETIHVDLDQMEYLFGDEMLGGKGCSGSSA